MNISKTLFKEYSKCERIFPLGEIYKKKLNQKVNFFDEDRNEKILELLSSFYDEDGDDLIAPDQTQIEAMLPFYQDVERVAIEIASKVFKKDFVFCENTKDQKCFSFTDDNGYTFYCYLDGYVEDKDEAIVIEVKSISSTKLKKLASNNKGISYPLFTKNNNIYTLVNENDYELGKEKYSNNLEKLFNKNDDFGKYVYDLAVERYIIENSIIKNNLPKKKIKYYLAVLNSDFILEKDLSFYNEKSSVINFVDLTDVTYWYLEKIDKIKEKIVKNILENKLYEPKFHKDCGFSGREKCQFFKVCWKDYVKKGSVLDYMGRKSFKTDEGRTLQIEDLVNKNYKRMEDIPCSWIKNDNQLIQRKCFDENIEYIDKEKIALGLKEINYPIYHLDFEAFNAPLPRFFGEKPFSQSVFQFSIHKEMEENKCDLVSDNVAFVASDFSDQREELVKKMIDVINLKNGGTVLVYNKTFEYNRIKEFITYFPHFEKELQKILDHMIDLEDIIHKGKEFYSKLGIDKERGELINFYNNCQCGRYSIKKLLPVFSNLSYDTLNIYNGVIASCSYAKFRYLSNEEIEEIRTDLIEYCGQDTWSMVVILKGLKEKIKQV